jgi:membrane protease subunit HflC
MRSALTFIFLVILGIGAFVAYNAFFIVHQTKTALVLEFGMPIRVVSKPGLNTKLPFVQTVEYFDKRILDIEITEREVIASDQKRLKVDAFARYKIVDPLLFSQRVRDEANAKTRISSAMDSALRGILGGATFTDVVKQRREELMGQIAQQVSADAKDWGIEIVDVRIKRADLPEANSNAIFTRMQTERAREAAELRAQGSEQAQRIKATADRQRTIIVAEANRDAERLRGEGDAERNSIYAAAFSRDPDFFAFYRSMQAYEEGLKANDTRLVITPNSEFFRYFNDPNGGSSATPAPAAPEGNGSRQGRAPVPTPPVQ